MPDQKILNHVNRIDSLSVMNKVGYQTIQWGRKIDDLDEVFAIIARAGFTGVEIAQSPKNLGGIQSASELKSLLDHYELELLGLAGGTLSERVKFAGDTFSNIYCYIERWDVHDEPHYRMAMDKGFRLALHPHLFKRTQTRTQAEELLNQHRGLYYLPDIAHLTIVGDNPLELLEKVPLNRFAAIHVKDWTPEYGRSSHNYARGFTEIGSGSVPIREFLNYVQVKGYDDWLVCEQDSSKLPPSSSVQWNGEQLQKLGLVLSPRLREPLSTYRKSQSVQGAFCAAQKEALLSVLIDSTTKGQRAFLNSAAEVFCNLLKCRFATVWACATAGDFLSLLAIYPRPKSNCLDMKPAVRDSLSREVLDGHKIQSFDLSNPQIASRSSNQSFFLHENLTSMLSLPIVTTNNPNHVIYLVNFFNDAPFDRGSDEELMNVAHFFSILSDRVQDDASSIAAGRVDIISAEPKNKMSFVNSLRELILATFNCQAVSIFLVDSTGSKLELAADIDQVHWNRREHFYSYGEGLTGGIWMRNQFLITPDAEQEGGFGFCGISAETVETPERDECLLGPISTSFRHVIGVVRCVNKRTNQVDLCSTVFTDDDAALLESILLAAAPRLEMLIKHEKSIAALNSLGENIRFPLLSIGRACKRLKRQDTTAASRSREIEFIESGLLLLHSFLHYGELLSKRSVSELKPVVKLVALREAIIEESIACCRFLVLDDESKKLTVYYDENMPEVYADIGMMRYVFFELLFTAFRARRDADFHLNIKTSGNQQSGLKIDISHNGNGIHPDRMKFLFQEDTFALCREIVQKHNGNLTLEKPTHFRIRLESSSVRFLTYP